MRCLSLREIDAFFTLAGVRVYEPRPVGTPYRRTTIAIHAGAEPTSWKSMEREMRRDPVLRVCMQAYGLDDRRAFNGLPRGAIVGIVRLDSVVPVAGYEVPPLAGEVTRLKQATHYWCLTVVRAIEPVIGIRARSNLWTLPDDLVRRVEAAPARAIMLRRDIPQGLGGAIEALPVADQLIKRARLEKEAKALLDRWDLQRAHTVVSTRTAGREQARREKRLQRGILSYLGSRMRRGPVDAPLIHVDTANPYLKAAFGEKYRVTPAEFRDTMLEWLSRPGAPERVKARVLSSYDNARKGLKAATRAIARAEKELRVVREFERRVGLARRKRRKG
jgi:hypothetical protein